MGFGVRIMPGVRVRVSRRGIRTSIGPRIARVHVGAGRTGFSTGMGPFSYSTSVGSSRRRSSGGAGSSSGQMTISQMEKILQADQIQTRIKDVIEAHREDFPEAVPQIAGIALVPHVDRIARLIFREAARSISVFAFAARKQLKLDCAELAGEEKKRLEKLEIQKQAKAQAILDAEWEHLFSNDPELLMPLLAEAFGDNEATCTPLSIKGSTLAVLMLAPSTDLVPDKKVGSTPTGRVSVRQMKVSERKELYFDVVFSQTVACIREAFAVAPGIKAIDFVMVRSEAHAKLGGGNLACVGFGHIERDEIGAQSLYDDPFLILANSASKWTANISRTLDLGIVNLNDEPEIQALLDAVNEGND